MILNIEKCKLDFVDVLTLKVMRKNNVIEIYTNDKNFETSRVDTQSLEVAHTGVNARKG